MKFSIPVRSDFRNIVVRGTNWVGDTVMTIPALRHIRSMFPDSRITLWAPKGLIPLLETANLFDDFMGIQPGKESRFLRPFTAAIKLKKNTFDAAILLQNAFESALTARLAHVPIRIGYPTDLRGPLLTHKAFMPADIRKHHEVYYYLQITNHLAKLLHLDTYPGEPDCTLDIDANTLGRGADFLLAQGLNPKAQYICMCPGSVNSEAKRWPPDYFAQCGSSLQREGFGIVFLGSPSERVLIDSIIETMSCNAINCAGADIPISMAIMHNSQLVISNDTGSAHLAVASSAKVLTIFGPTIPGATAPFGKDVHIMKGEAPCAPCRTFYCKQKHHRCMRSITPDSVRTAAINIIHGNQYHAPR